MLKKTILNYLSQMIFLGILGWLSLTFLFQVLPAAAAVMIGSVIIPLIVAGMISFLFLKIAIGRAILKQRSSTFAIGITVFIFAYLISLVVYKLIVH